MRHRVSRFFFRNRSHLFLIFGFIFVGHFSSFYPLDSIVLSGFNSAPHAPYLIWPELPKIPLDSAVLSGFNVTSRFSFFLSKSLSFVLDFRVYFRWPFFVVLPIRFNRFKRL